MQKVKNLAAYVANESGLITNVAVLLFSVVFLFRTIAVFERGSWQLTMSVIFFFAIFLIEVCIAAESLEDKKDE